MNKKSFQWKVNCPTPWCTGARGRGFEGSEWVGSLSCDVLGPGISRMGWGGGPRTHDALEWGGGVCYSMMHWGKVGVLYSMMHWGKVGVLCSMMHWEQTTLPPPWREWQTRLETVPSRNLPMYAVTRPFLNLRLKIFRFCPDVNYPKGKMTLARNLSLTERTIKWDGETAALMALGKKTAISQQSEKFLI